MHKIKSVLVVTCTYNSQDYILDCIESVKASITLGHFTLHHVIIDDKSTDQTVDIISKQKSENLSVILLDKNQGPAEARNIAINSFDADYIFVLDSDDMLIQNGLRYMFEYIEAKRCLWVYGDFLRCDEHGIYTKGYDYYGWPFKDRNEVLVSMFMGEHFFQQNCMYSRPLFMKVHGYNKDILIGEDFDLFTKFLLLNSFPYYLPSTIYFHRNHANNLTREYTTDSSLRPNEISNLFKTYKPQLHKVLKHKQWDRVEAFIKGIEEKK